MTDPITSWYIAMVWMGRDAYDLDTRQVIRLPATDADDFRAQVRALWPNHVVSFGPVVLSMSQE